MEAQPRSLRISKERNNMKVVGVHVILYTILKGRDGDNTIGILLQKRNHLARIYPGHWACFGGSLEGLEAEKTALSREIEEEIYIERKGTLVPLIVIPIYREAKNLAMSFYTQEVSQLGISLKGDESLGFAFFNPEEIHHLIMRPEDRLAVNEFLKRGI